MSRTDSASRVIAAPVDAVYAALVDPVALVRWLPPEGMSGRFEHFDLRPGGGYRLVLTYDDPDTAEGKTTADSDVTVVRFLDLVPGEKIIQAVDFESTDPNFSGTMTMTWRVAAVEAGSEVSIVAEGVPSGISAEDHAIGLASSLQQLAVELEGPAPWSPATVVHLPSLRMGHGPVPTDQVVAGNPSTAAVLGGAIDDVEIGVWEITPGTVTDVEAEEYFVVLSGRATVRFLEPTRPEIEIGPGDLVRLTAGMRTEWEVHETLRKVFVVAGVA